MSTQGESIPEYLSYTPEIPYTVGEMVNGKFIMPIPDLVEHLVAARATLVDTEGPNRQTRIESAPSFLDRWIGYFKDYQGPIDPSEAGRKLLSLEEVAVANLLAQRQGLLTGCTFANSCEGGQHHRSMVKHITSVIGDREGFVGLLIDENLSPSKSRKTRFLPQQMTLTMWALYYTNGIRHHPSHKFGLDYLAVIPENPPTIPVDEYYNEIFRQTNAQIYFVEQGDPHYSEKMKRNDLRHLFAILDVREPQMSFAEVISLPIIPHENALSTTRMVRKMTDVYWWE